MRSGLPKVAAGALRAAQRQAVEARMRLEVVEMLDAACGAAAAGLQNTCSAILRESAAALERNGYEAYPLALREAADALDAISADAARKLGQKAGG